jgi:hypothetical protein
MFKPFNRFAPFKPFISLSGFNRFGRSTYFVRRDSLIKPVPG